MGDFGDKFRKARVAKEFSFDDVSNVIKISPRMLKAIEEEQFDQLPGGVFNKGFIRAYAKHLGLDPEESITEYLDLSRKTQIAAQQAWQSQVQAETTPAPPPKAAPKPTPAPAAPVQPVAAPVEELPELQLPRAEHVRPSRKNYGESAAPEIPWRLIAVGVVVVILAVLLWTRRSHVLRTQATAPVSEASKPAAQPAPASSVVQGAAMNAPANASMPQPAASITPEGDDFKNDVTVRNFGKPLPKAAEKSGAMTLIVRADENSWISVMADGQLLTEETLIAPAHSSFHASREFTIKVGNAGAVSFSFNGTDIPAQGTEGEVKTLVFDSNGLRGAQPTQPVTNP